MFANTEEILAPERWPSEEAVLIEEEKKWLRYPEAIPENTPYEEPKIDPEIDDTTPIDELTAKDIRPMPKFTPGLEALINTLLFKTRKEQVAIYFQGIDWLREQLRQVETRDQLYALVDVASELDAAIMAVNTWNKGWDAYAKLETCFSNAERNIKRLEAIAAEQERKSQYARAYWLERSRATDNQRVPA
jgi:primosomal protein N''